jgi:O-acetyl-ADP-ribose deacetylase (regulator of RNase III)
MPLEVITGDILEQDVEAIVIPVVPYGKASSKFTRRVYKTAGSRLLKARRKFKHISVGESKITSGFNLKSKYVIHVGVSSWYGGSLNETKYLTTCYCTALKIAMKYHIKSVAFTLLGAGANRFPFDVAKKVAEDTIDGYLKAHSSDMQVYLVIHDRLEVKPPVETVSYVSQYAEYDKKYSEALASSQLSKAEFNEKRVRDYLIKHISNEETVARLIDYDKSSISRFVSGRIKKPRKSRVIALALAMELCDEERYDFIRCVGYKYPNDERDYLVEETIRSGKRNFTSINDALCQINPEYSLK